MFEDATVDDYDVCFAGDSITRRGLWSEFYPEWEVANRGIGSDTSEGLLNRLDQIVDTKAEKVFVMVGINDFGKDVDVQQTASNVEQAVGYLEANMDGCTVYLESVLPAATVDDALIRELNGLYSGIADAHGRVEYIDLHDGFTLADGAQDMGLFSADGVHLNGEGYVAWMDALAAEGCMR